MGEVIPFPKKYKVRVVPDNDYHDLDDDQPNVLCIDPEILLRAILTQTDED